VRALPSTLWLCYTRLKYPPKPPSIVELRSLE
jgi:hypothetical protein